MGYTDDALARPIIGITNTYSGFNACHRTVPELTEAVKRGVMLAGGLPVDFPTISLHESFAHPTSMYLRNLMAIDAEEMIRGQPVDAVVPIGGSIVLHVTPESAIGGPLALVRTGDRIRLDVPKRALELLVSDEELAARRTQWQPRPAAKGDERGYRKLFLDTVQQADRGCDFDFLAPEVTMRIPAKWVER